MITSDEDLRRLFEHLDTDNSGSLDWEEFKSMTKQAHLRNFVMDYIPLVLVTQCTDVDLMTLKLK